MVDNAGERERLRELARDFVERGDRAAAIATLEQALSSTQDMDLALNSALAQLCLQERQFAASASLSGTPLPYLYIQPTLYWAPACPRSAAMRIHFTASAPLIGTLSPSS